MWWRLRRPDHEAALVAIHVGCTVLLLRSSYRSEWNFPGGKTKPGETPEAAARRELMEEITFIPPGLTPIGVITGNWHGRRERIHFFEARLDKAPEFKIDNREIIEARLVPLPQLDKFALTPAIAAYFSGIEPSGSM
jgi:8-oxo-dGTP pyrophosphatase MutT (NUDIX family)